MESKKIDILFRTTVEYATLHYVTLRYDNELYYDELYQRTQGTEDLYPAMDDNDECHQRTFP